MNRTIKFRGKRIANDEWVYGSLLIWADGECTILEKSDSSNAMWKREIAPATVGQFTGLTDCDGREIYEGDVIESRCTDMGIVRHMIAYHAEGARFTTILINKDMNDDSLRALCPINKGWITKYGKRVAGNIHDNPELLNTDDR